MKKEEYIKRVCQDIIENVHTDKGYRELAKELIESGLTQWTLKELKEYCDGYR